MKKILYILLFVPIALFGQTSFEELIENTSLNEGLSAFYPFNGNASDVSGNNLNGIVVNAQLATDMYDEIGSSYLISTESYIELPNIDLQSISLNVWVMNPHGTIISKHITASYNSSYILYVDEDSNQIIAYFTDINNSVQTAEFNLDLLVNDWNMLTMSVDSESISLYLNGQIINQDLGGIIKSTDYSTLIGASRHASGVIADGGHGGIDQLGVWDRALTSEEVELLFLGVTNGCTDSISVNYNDTANVDDGSCLSVEEYTIDSLETELLTLNEEATTSLSSLQQALDTWNTTIDLDAGWNMFGYGCPNPIDVVEGLSNYTDKISLVKDNNGSVYISEFSFDGIGNLTPGFGYQIKVTEAIEGFSLCDWYVNDIPEDNIVSLQEENASLQAELDSIYGCTGSWACNYDETAILNDGSCYDNDMGCGCDTPLPIDGYDCYGNQLIANIGDTIFGGIVFFIDSTGQHGLVAAMEDLTEGATDLSEWGFNGYEWGCYDEYEEGADGTSIGTGYQNTMDIVNQGCVTYFGGITAAQAAIDAEINDYSDWYLPSTYELIEMYNTIGNGGPEGNIGGFDTGNFPYYWSSSEDNEYYALGVDFIEGMTLGWLWKFDTCRVRPIRSF